VYTIQGIGASLSEPHITCTFSLVTYTGDFMKYALDVSVSQQLYT